MAVKYGVAAGSVAAALVIARILELRLVSAPVSLFLCAILFGAWFGGVGPGLLAVVLSHLGFDYYFVAPLHSLMAPGIPLARMRRLLSGGRSH